MNFIELHGGEKNASIRSPPTKDNNRNAQSLEMSNILRTNELPMIECRLQIQRITYR